MYAIRSYYGEARHDPVSTAVFERMSTSTGGKAYFAKDWQDQQSGMVLHRTRSLLVRQQTSTINAIRAHLAEFGIVAPLSWKGEGGQTKVADLTWRTWDVAKRLELV